MKLKPLASLKYLTLVILLITQSCITNLGKSDNNSNTRNTKERAEVVIEKKAPIEAVVSCGNIRLYRKQMNHIYLCVESSIAIRENDSIEIDLSAKDLRGWTIYLDNRNRCGDAPSICTELKNNRTDEDCSKKLLPTKGLINVVRNKNELEFIFTETEWEMEGVSLTQNALQFSVELIE